MLKTCRRLYSTTSTAATTAIIGGNNLLRVKYTPPISSFKRSSLVVNLNQYDHHHYHTNQFVLTQQQQQQQSNSTTTTTTTSTATTNNNKNTSTPFINNNTTGTTTDNNNNNNTTTGCTSSTNQSNQSNESTTTTTDHGINSIKNIIHKRLNQVKTLETYRKASNFIKNQNYQEYQEWIGKTYSLIDRIKQFYENVKYKLTYYGKFYLSGFKLIGADTKKYLQLKKEINNNRPFHLANRSEIYFTTQYSIELLKAIPFIVLFFPFSTIYFALAFVFPILLPTQLVLPRKKVQILNNINRLRSEQSKLIIDRLIQFTNLVNNRYIVVDDELMKQCNTFTNILTSNIKNRQLPHLERKEYIRKFLKELKELDNTKFVDQFLKFNFMSTTLLDDICRFSLIGRSHLGGISGAIKEDNTSAIYGLRKYDPNILQQLLMNFFDVLASDEFVQAITPNTIKMYQLNRFINQLREDDQFIKMDVEVSNVLNIQETQSLREWLKICYVRALIQDPTCYGGVNTVLMTHDDLIMAGEHAPLTSTNTLGNLTQTEHDQLIDELRELHDIWLDFTRNIKSNELLIVACILLK